MTVLSSLLDHYRQSSESEREKLCHRPNDATYRDLIRVVRALPKIEIESAAA